MTKIARWSLLLALLVTFPSWSRAGDGVVAIQSADPSCADDSSDIYVDCGNGTVTDNRTGLVWLRNANCLGSLVNWRDAMDVVAGLSDLEGSDPDDCGLSDNSSPGEWRLPSKMEWETMVADALGCDPTISNDQGDGCWGTPLECFVQDRNCSFEEVQSASYWSSTTNQFLPATSAWRMVLGFGNLGASFKTDTYLVWPVRGGQ